LTPGGCGGESVVKVVGLTLGWVSFCEKDPNERRRLGALGGHNLDGLVNRIARQSNVPMIIPVVEK
jgi:hypothetical protein